MYILATAAITVKFGSPNGQQIFLIHVHVVCSLARWITSRDK